MIKFYIIGVFIAFILGCILMYKDKSKDQQCGILAIVSLMSWLSVILICWKYRDKFLA